MSQFHPTQHVGDSDFQMWQQQMMYKQLQEFQRQQQLQQSDHGSRMQPSFGQFHSPAKPLLTDHLSTVTNEMPNNEGMSSAWPHNFNGGDPRLTSNSQMLNNGNTNWDQFIGAPGAGNFINGSVFANAQNQSMRPMGLAAQQMDQSFYPMHASSRGSGNQYSQFLGIPADSQSAMARVGADQSQSTSRPFNSSMNEHGVHPQGASSLMQNFRGKGGFLSNSPMQSQGDNMKAGSPVTMNHLQHGFQTQDFHGRTNQVDLQMGMQEKSSMQVGQASGRASLDPTEEKILFGNDEGSNWGALLRGESDNGNSLDNDNFGGGLPSLQSGSWSALMQEALQSTTSENSPKEEWSGLSFQKTEQIVANNSTLSGRDENKLAALSGTNLENVRSSPASSYADVTINNPNLASFQHAMRTPYERRDQMPRESPRAPHNNHQSASEVNNGYFQQSLKQIQSDGRQEQVQLANGIWTHQKSEMLRNNVHSPGTQAMPPVAHGFWMSQQNTTDHSINRESSNNQNDWKANTALGQDINNTPNVFNSNENSWKSSGGNANSAQRLQQRKSDISSTQMPNESSDGKNISMMNSSMPMMAQDHYQMITGRSGEQVGMNRNMGHRVPETSESPGKSADQRPSDFNQEYLNETPNERQAHLLNHGQHTSDSAPRRHSVLAGKESENLGQSGQQAMGSYMLQSRAMGSSGMNIGPSPGNPVSNSLFPPQSHQMRNNLQHHFGTNSHVSNNMPSVNEKMIMAQEQLQSRQGLPSSSNALPFGGTDAGLSQNRGVQNSQHMLQLLHKVDNSRNSNSNAVADMPNSSVGVVSAQQQLGHSSLQGFGLRLAPPSQRQSNSGHLWSSHTNVDGKQPDHSAQESDRTQLPSTTSQSLTPPHTNAQSSPFHTSETDNTGQPIGNYPQLSSGQQYPVTEDRSGHSPMQQQPQQGSSATVFKNVWTNISAQRLAGMQANKITPNILQSMMFPNNAAASNLWNSQKTDDQGQKAATPSDIATSSANSQNQDSKQAVDSDVGLTSSQKANFESTPSGGNESLQKPSDGNFVNAVSSFAQLRQQGILGAKHVESPAANFQAMNASHNTANNSGGIVLHGSPAPSNIQQQNYSLLHQMQAMRHTDIDPTSSVGKAIKSEIGSDASQIDWKSGQRFAHVANSTTKPSTDNTGSPGVPGSFPSDMKMLSFASRNEERNPSIPSQLPSVERPSHGMITAQNDNQNQVQPIGTSTSSSSVERIERPRINPQMAPSWFGHYGNYRNGQSVAMLNAQKSTTSPYNVQKASWNNDNNSVDHRVESGQSVRPGQYLPSTKMDALVPSNVKASSMMRRPRKRKAMESSALVSWHKIIESPQKLRNISASEMDWAWAANRLIEKDEAETLDDGPLNYLPRKRLILTTQLIQQLLPAIPATVLRAQAVSAYESATYTLSMLTLRDACSMASSLLYNSCSLVDDENNPSEQITSAKKMEDKVSKAVEVFVGRIRKMENDFISLNKRASMLDVQLECQDLERISIVNRLGKFHGRNHAAAVEGSSASDMTRRIFPERHVMSFAVPGNLPEGVYCLSL